MLKETSMPEKHPRRRTHYFVKKSYQLNFIFQFCSLVFLGAVISTGLLFFLSHGTLTTSFEHSRVIVKKTALAILPSLIYTNIITLILITIATIIVVLIISHKIVGPILRFEKYILEIEQGDLTGRIRLREKDQVQDLAVSLNQMATSLHKKIADIRNDIDQLRESASGKDIPETFMNKLKDLDQKVDDYFTL